MSSDHDTCFLQMLTFIMLARLSSLCPSAVVQRLDRLVEPLRATCTTKVPSSHYEAVFTQQRPFVFPKLFVPHDQICTANDVHVSEVTQLSTLKRPAVINPGLSQVYFFPLPPYSTGRTKGQYLDLQCQLV